MLNTQKQKEKQKENEELYNKNNLLKQIRQELEEDLNLPKQEIIVLTSIVIAQTITPIISIASQCSHKLSKDPLKGVSRALEIIQSLASQELIELNLDTLQLISNIELSPEGQEAVENMLYQLPLLVPPKEIKNNKDCGYYTYSNGMILGKNNTHNNCISLDVINIQNHIPLKLDIDFINSHKEEPTKPLQTPWQKENWKQFQNESTDVYNIINNSTFYLTNKPDKRGRIYACGYHINTQGPPYKKAIIRFAEEEFIDVPQEYRL